MFGLIARDDRTIRNVGSTAAWSHDCAGVNITERVYRGYKLRRCQISRSDEEDDSLAAPTGADFPSLHGSIGALDVSKGLAGSIGSIGALDFSAWQLWGAGDALSASAILSRSIASELLSGTDLYRRPRAVDQQFLTALVEYADQAAPAADTNDAIRATLRRASPTPIPLDQDQLLSDDAIAVESWIGLLLRNFMEVSGLNERDLLEDAVATLAYSATMALAIALLVSYPALLILAAPTGFAGKDPAMYMSRLARRGFQQMNEH